MAGFSLYSAGPGRRFIAPLDPRHETYRRMLGLLEFARYDPALLCGELDAEPREAVERCLAGLTERGLLEAEETGGVCRPTEAGVFWGNNMAAEILEAAIGAAQTTGGAGL
jgi:hypothetical protein